MEFSEFSEFGVRGFGRRAWGFDCRIQGLESKTNLENIQATLWKIQRLGKGNI